MTELDNYFFKHSDDINACLMALRDIIQAEDPYITLEWKYSMPFFCYKGKMFCYLWVHKTLHQPYIGIVEGKHLDHPRLIQEKRARMKIMLLDSNKDLPVRTIKSIIGQAIQLYKNGTVKLKN